MLAFSIENPNKISKSARLTGRDAFNNSLATRIRLEVGLTPFLFKIFSMSILFIYYELSQYFLSTKVNSSAHLLTTNIPYNTTILINRIFIWHK